MLPRVPSLSVLNGLGDGDLTEGIAAFGDFPVADAVADAVSEPEPELGLAAYCGGQPDPVGLAATEDAGIDVVSSSPPAPPPPPPPPRAEAEVEVEVVVVPFCSPPPPSVSVSPPPSSAPDAPIAVRTAPRVGPSPVLPLPSPPLSAPAPALALAPAPPSDDDDAPISHAIIDTPGQIEIFAWSASGSIMTDALAASLPTCILFVMDSPRCASPPTALVANLLQAASILYRTRLPLLLAFNKADVGGSDAVASWVEDWEKLDEALSKERAYAASLARSLSLVLDEFTSALPHVSVSAATGQGMPELVEKLEECRRRYYEEYRPGIEAARGARREAEAARRAAELGRLRADGGIGEEGVEGLERAVRAVNIGGGEGEEEGSGGAP